jgi:hypothetical protein
MNKVVKDIIDQVLKAYTPYYDKEWEWGASQFFHYERTYQLDSGYSIEPPWKKARTGLDIMDRGHNIIKDTDIKLYYSQQLEGGTNGTKDNESSRHSKEGSGGK